MFTTKLDVRSLFDAQFLNDTTKVLSLLARYFSFSASKCHKKQTQHDREIDNQTVKFSEFSESEEPLCDLFPLAFEPTDTGQQTTDVYIAEHFLNNSLFLQLNQKILLQ